MPQRPEDETLNKNEQPNIITLFNKYCKIIHTSTCNKKYVFGFE